MASSQVPNDDMQWMSGVDGGAGQAIDEVLRSTGALLVGRRTQDVEDGISQGSTAVLFAAHSSCSATIHPPNLPS